MSMTEEMFEILVGKYLDGEITPSEQRILESHLNENPQSEALLRQLYDLHEQCGELIGSELIGRGQKPQDVFEQAWQKSRKKSLHKIINIGGYFRFLGGVAAGLIIGLSIYFVLPERSSTMPSEPPINVATDNVDNDIESVRPDNPQLNPQIRNNITNVDWYTFTDKQGNQWLLEGYRQNIVQPAIYRKGL